MKDTKVCVFFCDIMGMEIVSYVKLRPENLPRQVFWLAKYALYMRLWKTFTKKSKKLLTYAR